MTDTLSPERVAEIRARVADCANVADMYLAFDKPVIAKRLRISVGDVSALLASHEALRAEVERLERSVLEEIDNRDEREEWIGRIYQVVVGEQPEWSNLFGFQEACNAIEDTCSAARDTAAREMRKAVERVVSNYVVGEGPSLLDRILALPLPSETKETE